MNNTLSETRRSIIGVMENTPITVHLRSFNWILHRAQGWSGSFWGGFLGVCLVALLVSGCTTSRTHPPARVIRNGYSGTDLEQKQAVLIEGQIKEYPDNVIGGSRDVSPHEVILFEKVDELVVGNVKNGWPNGVRVLPGRHHITLFYYNNRISSANGGLVGLGIFYGRIKALDRFSVELDAQEGHRYEVKYKSDGKSLINGEIWIEDLTSASSAIVAKATIIP